MLVVGLTGGIATGKSSVSSLLSSRHNVPIVDADLLAREVVEPGTHALRQIVKAFGSEILTEEGRLNRPALGRIIFNDAEKRKVLNKIVHPAVHRAMVWAILKLWISGHKWCVLDVPLLIEGGLWKWVAKVVLVYCPPDSQLERLMKRDGSSQEDASSRLNSQTSIKEKVAYADEIIDNSNGIAALEEKVKSFVRRVELEIGWTWMLSWFSPPFAILSGGFCLARRAWQRSKSQKNAH